jgi:hypothetical protein
LHTLRRLQKFIACCTLLMPPSVFGQSDGYPPSVSTPEIRKLESTHYLPYTPRQSGKSLEDEAQDPANSGKKEIVRFQSFPHPAPNRGASKEKELLLHLLIANSDAVVIGRPLNAVAEFTEDKNFIFTDYQFRVDTVLLDRKRQINGGQLIVVSRAGGSIETADKTFKAVDPEFSAFEIDGTYLIFLIRTPDTNTFVARAADSFQLTGKQSIPCWTPSKDAPAARDQDEFMKVVWQFTNSESNRQQ